MNACLNGCVFQTGILTLMIMRVFVKRLRHLLRHAAQKRAALPSDGLYRQMTDIQMPERMLYAGSNPVGLKHRHIPVYKNTA